MKGSLENEVKSAALSDEEAEEVAGGAGEWEQMGKVQGTTVGKTFKQETGAPKAGGTVPGPTPTVRPRR